MDQLALYIEQSKRSDETQTTEFDLLAVQEEIQKQANPVKIGENVVNEDLNSVEEQIAEVADEAYTEVEDTAKKAIKKFNDVIEIYNDGNNALICYMLLIIIVLLFLNLLLND